MTDNETTDDVWLVPNPHDLDRANTALNVAVTALGFTYPEVPAATLHEFFWLIARAAHDRGDVALATAAQVRGIDLQDDKKYP